MLKLNRLKWIFNPCEVSGLDFTHAQVPTPLVMDDRIRVFISGRINKISHVFTIDLAPPPSFHIISVSTEPIFSPNPHIGTFDDEGVMPSCFVKHENKNYFFYSGWNSRNTIPYHNSTGIAIYDETINKITRLYDGPVMERTHEHPYLAVTPCVWEEDGKFMALYISGLRWELNNGKYEPIYVIKEAVSTNLLNWNRPQEQAVASNFKDECFSNPTVFKIDGELYSLFCSRNAFDFRINESNSYRIGAAKRVEGKFIREEILWSGMKTEKESVMQCYPHFFEWDKKVYVLYNGNGFGWTGFGVAEISST